MAIFRCIVSGNTVEFNDAYNLQQMRRQVLDYVEVDKDGVPVKEDDQKAYPDWVKKSSKVKEAA